MAEDMGSTVPRRRLGKALRDLRTEAGITLDAAAEALECSRQKVWRIESGLGSARGVDVRAMCELYAAAPDMTRALLALAAETKTKGWWHAYGDAIPDWFELYVGLESAASRLRFYNESMVPGLLQHRDYALGVYQHRTEVSDEDRERFVQVRLQRQALLKRRLPPPPKLDVILSEAALLRTVGDAATMVNQLRHLLALADMATVSIRILPLAAGLHRGSEAGSFVLLEFPLGNRATPEPSVVYSESWTGALYLDRPEEFNAYEKVWTSLDLLALDEGQSRHFINKIIGEVHHG
ncbi:helix-turn-helix domain-containing protein [Micromonospora carbonacea]|uniref:Helix-turn-helix domain-containing protein n=1 Tax=Micromonospora carbonacea TaxID=47853 RepID=A0A7H8XI06_9ACTN|nr:helix-turn-helix transcriptional regulator [Micromonospora carbonacea]MBB5828264.1 transcriptional regulator with XRE-family HTH domain [Micromonospora carbonacea]QLD24108.1 helix-turn-helix domain-containing protein [Micromonospora carbonacea]